MKYFSFSCFKKVSQVTFKEVQSVYKIMGDEKLLCNLSLLVIVVQPFCHTM
jgi:hypothetical protein